MIVYYSRTTGHICVEGLHSKSVVLVAVSLERYEQICGPIAQLHHDCSTEFLGATSAYCHKQGIQQTFTCPYLLFQNSNAESTVGYVKCVGRRILLESGLPDPFWLRCMHTTARSRSDADTRHGRWHAMRCIRSGRASAAQFQTAVVARVGRPSTGFGAADAHCVIGHAARRAADGDMSCLFETAVLQQSRSLFELVYQIFSGDDLINEKDADSRPDCEEWRLAKWAELNALIGMGCWRYRPKSDKHNDPVEKKKKLYHSKFVFKQKPSANGMPPRKKARHVSLTPSSFRN